MRKLLVLLAHALPAIICPFQYTSAFDLSALTGIYRKALIEHQTAGSLDLLESPADETAKCTSIGDITSTWRDAKNADIVALVEYTDAIDFEEVRDLFSPALEASKSIGNLNFEGESPSQCTAILRVDPDWVDAQD